MTTNMEWTEGDLVWFETNIGHPLPGEVQEVHRAAQVIIVQAVINGKKAMRIVRFHLEPWQRGGSNGSEFSTSSSLSSFPPLNDSVLRRQRAYSSDELSNIDTNLFERRSTLSHPTSWHSSYFKRKLPQMVKRLSVLCSDVLAQNPETFTLGMSEGNLQRRQDLGTNGVDDMTQLEDLHEASLLWNLRLRYDTGQIYTFAGSILIAVNPYKMIPDSYGIQMAKKYAGKSLGIMPPHLFAIAASAHASLPTPQAIVISGESGSGKTESTKLVMQYLAAIVPGGGNSSAVITEQILEAGPLLEVFGNARTTRNDNSSRFGKYVEIYFKHGAIVGAKITQYLLEKSRIVTHAPGERNYHVFYELFGGLSESERAKYGLLDVNKYFYLNQGGSDCGPGRIDWASLQGAMQVMGVSDKEQNGIIRILAAVLHLGNIYFHRRQLRHGQEGVELGSDAEIKWAAHLLQISDEDLHRTLTTRLTETRTERLFTPLGIDQALDARDALAKVLYSGLFNWLVSRINTIVHKGGTHDAHRISILDIFGFEDLAENNFEQLCINYANENLHLYFNKHVFKLEQAEYARERLEWVPLPWEDNLPVIHLLAKKPVGIFHLLDDESNFPRASDLSFLEKCHYNHALNELYSRPRIGAQEFGIQHYAGQVWYNVEGFLEKNRDAVRLDALDLLSTSDLPIMKEIFKQLRAQRDNARSLPRNSNGTRFVTMKPRTPTVGARFSDSLQHLLQSMAKCNPWFIRCIKPNNDKHALKMDMPCVLQQLRYLGMLDTIRIRQTGYPVRLRFQHFVERYRHMLKSPLPRGTPYRDLCRSVLEALPPTGIDGPDFQLGATRVFLREAMHRVLENHRSGRLRDAAIVIQRNVRKMLTNKQSQRKKRAAVKIQAHWKGYHQRKKYHNLKKGTIQLQALYRGRRQRKIYNKLKAELQRRRNAERAQRNQRERQQKAMAMEQERSSHLVQLDVPAELAFIFSKLDGWTSLHGDRHLVKVVGTVPGPPKTYDLPCDIDQFAFGKFSSVYCNGVQLSPKRDPITSPFLSRAASRDEDFQSSLAVFKLILRWANDKNLDTAKEKALADYIVHKGQSSRSVRDEILVQLCNQVYRIDESQSMRIWQLMSHCLSAFQPGPALHKYLVKFVSDNASRTIRETILRKLLRNSNSQLISCRLYPPTWLEWRANARHSDIALSLTLPDESTQTVAIDSWTTCEEAATLALSSQAVPSHGWTVVLDDSGLYTDSCGLDFVLDLISEKELCPAFPTVRSDLLRCGRKSSKIQTYQIEPESPSLKRPQVPPPEPPSLMNVKRHSAIERTTEKLIGNMQRKTSHDLLSRNSALNDRYFDSHEKSRSKSLDDLLGGGETSAAESVAEFVSQTELDEEHEELAELGLSESRLNERYHSSERLAPLRETPRYQKSQYAGKRSAGHSSKYMERSDYGTRSSAMSDTSEAPSLASHVRRVRVPSNIDQFSDVDQFLDDLFSPVLDGSLDELSDARSLSTSIRGGREEFFEAPAIDKDLDDLRSATKLQKSIKGGGIKDNAARKSSTDQEVQEINSNFEGSLDEYITELFQPIFVNDSLKRLTEKTELAESIKGGGTTHQTANASNGYSSSSSKLNNPVLVMGTNPDNFSSTSSVDQGQLQRAFLQSAMAQNIQIQQQLLAQNQALQTLLSQQSSSSPTGASKGASRKQSLKSQAPTPTFAGKAFERNGKLSSENGSHIPIPPPMPPPIEFNDPAESRPFLDPYGRAKTVRIGKWVWPPKGNLQSGNDVNFMEFKMRQNQRKNTPQSNSSTSPNGSSAQVEWDEFEVENIIIKKEEKSIANPGPVRKFSQENSIQPTIATTHITAKIARRSFEIGAERPPPGSVGKLKLSSEMRQRLEQVTAGHSVRSTTSTQSDQRTPAKLEDARRMMLQQQLMGHFGSSSDKDEADLPSVRTQVQRMEAIKGIIPPAPSIPAPQPPIRPPNIPAPIPNAMQMQQQQQHQKQNESKEMPSFYQKRQERDTFGIHQTQQNWNGSEISKDTYDSWGRAEAAKHDIYEVNYKKEMKNDRDHARSRSHSRDREKFAESVWDRNEVEGECDTRERIKEREKYDRMYEMKQVERERESQKVYQSANPTKISNNFEREKAIKKISPPTNERATFKTHMAQRMDRERKSSASTQITQSTDKPDIDTDIEWASNTSVPTAPMPILPAPKIPAAACLTYNRVPWKLRVRKEIFHPNESINSPAALNLLFAQIAGDIFDLTPCLRITPSEKRNALNMLGGHGVTGEIIKTQSVRAIVKRHLLDMARGWPLYFARLFIVSGSPQFPEVSLLAISHSGVYLARRESDFITVVRSVPLAELQGAITLPRPAALQLNMKNGNRIVLHAPRAAAIQAMIQTFCQEFKKVQSKASTISSGARAAAQTLNVPIERLEAEVHGKSSSSSPTINNNINNNNNNNNNHHHEKIRHHSTDEILPNHAEHNGTKHFNSIQQTQSHNYLQPESIQHSKSHHSPAHSPQQQQHQQQLHHHKNGMTNGNGSNIDSMHPDDQDDQQQFSSLSAMQPAPTTNAKYTLLQFAMQHFRDDNQSIEEHQINGRAQKRSTSSRPHGDLVKWQPAPIRSPLLRLPVELSPLAIECFDCILRYCGDLPPDPELTEVKCVYTILMHCHKHLTLRDEVYCQLMKQTTGNRSSNPDSCQRAWRLLSILAAYFSCSDALKPYLMEHLTASASDRRRSSHGTASVCLSNLRKTARCGGRKNVPSVEEVTAVSAGRSARRQIYRLPGGAERVVNTRGSTVVGDVIAELCCLLGIDSSIEQQEFSLYCIVQGDAFTMPLAADEYILDVTTELLKSGQPFYLIFCRSVWHFPLKRDPMPTMLYVEVLFNQVAPDYLEGLLLEMPSTGSPPPDVVRDMARIAALLHRAADLTHVPAMKEIKFLLPKPALGIRDLRPAQWVALVQSAWPSIAAMEPVQVKAQFLSVLSEWPLFGSSFFAVRKVWAEDGLNDDSNPIWKEIILALNRRGVLFLEPNTHETLRHWPFMEVISTRKVRSDDGALFLDMKVGNLMQQRVIRVHTEQAHEISRLIRQYITMAQMSRSDRRE